MTLKIGSGILRDDLIESNENKNIVNGYAGLGANAKLGTALFNSFTSAQQTITAAGALTLAHGLGAAPTMFQVSLVCQTGELGYTAGNELFVWSEQYLGCGAAITADATNIYIRYGNRATGSFSILRKDTGAQAYITNTKWKFVVRAWVM